MLLRVGSITSYMLLQKQTDEERKCCLPYKWPNPLILLILSLVSVIATGFIVYVVVLFVINPVNMAIEGAPGSLLSINQTVLIFLGAAVTYKIVRDEESTLLALLVQAMNATTRKPKQTLEGITDQFIQIRNNQSIQKSALEFVNKATNELIMLQLQPQVQSLWQHEADQSIQLAIDLIQNTANKFEQKVNKLQQAADQLTQEHGVRKNKVKEPLEVLYVEMGHLQQLTKQLRQTTIACQKEGQQQQGAVQQPQGAVQQPQGAVQQTQGAVQQTQGTVQQGAGQQQQGASQQQQTTTETQQKAVLLYTSGHMQKAAYQVQQIVDQLHQAQNQLKKVLDQRTLDDKLKKAQDQVHQIIGQLDQLLEQLQLFSNELQQTQEQIQQALNQLKTSEEDLQQALDKLQPSPKQLLHVLGQLQLGAHSLQLGQNKLHQVIDKLIIKYTADPLQSVLDQFQLTADQLKQALAKVPQRAAEPRQKAAEPRQRAAEPRRENSVVQKALDHIQEAVGQLKPIEENLMEQIQTQLQDIIAGQHQRQFQQKLGQLQTFADQLRQATDRLQQALQKADQLKQKEQPFQQAFVQIQQALQKLPHNQLNNSFEQVHGQLTVKDQLQRILEQLQTKNQPLLQIVVSLHLFASSLQEIPVHQHISNTSLMSANCKIQDVASQLIQTAIDNFVQKTKKHLTSQKIQYTVTVVTVHELRKAMITLIQVTAINNNVILCEIEQKEIAQQLITNVAMNIISNKSISDPNLRDAIQQVKDKANKLVTETIAQHVPKGLILVYIVDALNEVKQSILIRGLTVEVKQVSAEVQNLAREFLFQYFSAEMKELRYQLLNTLAETLLFTTSNRKRRVQEKKTFSQTTKYLVRAVAAQLSSKTPDNWPGAITLKTVTNQLETTTGKKVPVVTI